MVASSFKEFLSQPDTVDTKKPTAEMAVKEINPREPEITTTGKNKPDLLVKLGQQLDNLKGMLKSAELFKAPGRLNDKAHEAIQALKEMFPSQKTSIQKVVLPKALVDHYGGNPNELQFGAQTINSDAQYEKLKKEVEIAKKYFGDNIYLHKINYDNGKPPVAVVMGVNAEEFNAVISAERQKAKLEETIIATRKEMMHDAPGHGHQNAENLEKTAQLAGKADVRSMAEGTAPDLAHVPGQGKERNGPGISA